MFVMYFVLHSYSAKLASW